MRNEGTEADAIGWEYSQDDIAKEERGRTGKLDEFELMLEYHGLDEQDWQLEAVHSRRHLWWNYRNIGRRVL